MTAPRPSSVSPKPGSTLVPPGAKRVSISLTASTASMSAATASSTQTPGPSGPKSFRAAATAAPSGGESAAPESPPAPLVEGIFHPIEEPGREHNFARLGRQILKQLALALGELRGHIHVDNYVEVAAGARPSQVRDAAAPQSDLGAGLRARPDLEFLLAFDGRDASPSTQRGLDDRQLQFVVDLGPVAAQEWMRRHVHGHVEVARGPAARTDLTLAGESDLVAFIYAGRDRDPDLLVAHKTAVALAFPARRVDDAALAVAARAGRDVDHLTEQGLADATDFASTSAGVARNRHAAGRGPGPGACPALVQQIELDLFLDASDCLIEGDAQVVAQVRAGLATVAPGAGGVSTHAGEERIEEIAEAAEALAEGRSRATHVAQSGGPDHVVDLAPFWIGQDLVGLVDLLEPPHRLGLGVDVGVPLLGELAEGALDVGLGRVSLDAENFVVASLGGHLVEKDTRRAGRTGFDVPDGPVLRLQQLAQSARSDGQPDRPHRQQVDHIDQQDGIRRTGRQRTDQMHASI